MEQCERTTHAAAYVLGQLGSHDLDDFARHLQTCDACAEEVELLEAAADAVPLLASRPPGREDLTPVSGRSNGALRTMHAPMQESEPRQKLHLVISDKEAREERLLQRRATKPMMFGFVALVVAAIVTVAITRNSSSITYVAGQAGWKGGGVRVSVQGVHGELLILNMPQPPAGKIYSIWLQKQSGQPLTPSGARFRPNSDGEAGVQIPGNINDYGYLVVFEEPVKGPQKAQSGAVVVVNLSPATDPGG